MLKAVAVAVTASPAVMSSVVMNEKETLPLRLALTFSSPKNFLPSSGSVEELEKNWRVKSFLGAFLKTRPYFGI